MHGARVRAADRRRITHAAGLLAMQLQLGAAFGSAVLATLIERGITRYHALLVAHTAPTNPALAAMAQQLAALFVAHAGSDAATARAQAMAALDNLYRITGQAAVLSFERAFQVVTLLALLMLACVLFLPERAGGPAAH